MRLPTGAELPVHVKGEFPQFYRAMFQRGEEGGYARGVPRVRVGHGLVRSVRGEPPSTEELRQLGVFWLSESGAEPMPGRPDPGRGRGLAPADVFVTRLHVRYDAAHLPDDLVFQETADRSNFQGRYVLLQPWKGEEKCAAAPRGAPDTRRAEAATLASLTGWPIADIRRKRLPRTACFGPTTGPGERSSGTSESGRARL